MRTAYGTLAARCENLKGPDRELDFLVWAERNGVTDITWPTEGHPMTPGKGGRVEAKDAAGDWHLYAYIDLEGDRNFQPYGGADRYSPVTGDATAAMSLKPVGWRVQGVIEAHGGVWLVDLIKAVDGADVHGSKVRGAGPTYEIAFTAASLRANAVAATERVPTERRETLCASDHCTDLPPHVQATGECHYAQARP